MPDLAFWLFSVALPAAVSAAACGVAIALRRRSAGNDAPESAGPLFDFSTVVLSLGWTAALLAALVGQRVAGDEPAFAWWPEEFSQRSCLPIVVAAVVMSLTAAARLRDLPVRWIAAGLLAIATAAISLPGGESWADMLPLHQGWSALLASACLINLWSLDRLSATGADRWFPLVVLAMLAGPLIVAAATYMGLVPWIVAAIAATAPVVLLALPGWIDSRTAAGIAYPATIFSAAMIGAGRFRSYEDLPWPSYLGMLLVPAAVLLVDFPLRSRHGLIRAAVAAVVAIAVLGVCAWLQYVPDGAGDW